MARLLGVPPVPTTPRETFQQLAWNFICANDGPQHLAAALWSEAQDRVGPVLIDGIRQRATLEALRELAAPLGIGVLFVHTLPDLAYAFYRDREANGISIFDFLRVRNAPVEREVESLITEGDAVLYNWIGRQDYQQAIRTLMRSVIGDKPDGRRIR
jgi:hypothetical protein